MSQPDSSPQNPGVRRGDRRNAYRYVAVRNLVFVGWWQNEEFRTITAILKDVSMGGASLMISGPAPHAESVWVSLYQVPPTEWAEATVVELHRVSGPRLFSRGHFMLRIKFPEHCSFEFFKAGIEEGAKNETNDAGRDAE